MKVTERYPTPYKAAKPMWSTRSRRPEQLAIMAGSAAVNKLPGGLSKIGPKEDDAMCKVAFEKGVAQYFRTTNALRRSFTRFTTTPDWEGVKGRLAGAASMFKQ